MIGAASLRLDIFADVVIVIFGHIKILFSNKK
jgi:hypothetical protein